MNKKELVDEFYKRNIDNGLITRASAERTFDNLLDIVSECLQSGDDVDIHGYGKLYVSERKGRAGVNPRTGDKIEVKSQNVVKFKCGAVLKKCVTTS